MILSLSIIDEPNSINQKGNEADREEMPISIMQMD
jgi:hypothetical protein